MSDNPELDQAYRETAMGLSDNLDKPLIAHNDAADGFGDDPFPDPGERLRGDPEAEADDESLEAALDRAMETFRQDDVKLSEFEKLVRTRLASFGPSLADRLEKLSKQLARLEANMAFVVSYVNTLALPVRDPLDLPDPPAGAAEFIEVMKSATNEVLGRRPDVPFNAGVPSNPGHIAVDPQDAALGSQAVNPNDPIDCTHPNDCQFPRCLCGTEFAAMGAHIGKTPERVAIESTRGPYAKVYDQNHAEPACTHTLSGGGGSVTGRTMSDGGHPMTLSEAPDCAGAKGGCPDVDGPACPRAHDGLSAQDICQLRDQMALTAILGEMDGKISTTSGFRELVLNETEFAAVRHAIARELGGTPQTKREESTKAYWIGGDGKLYYFDANQRVVRLDQEPVRPLTQAERSHVTGQPITPIGSLLDTLHSALEHNDDAAPFFQMPRATIHTMIDLATKAKHAAKADKFNPPKTPDHVLVARKLLTTALDAFKAMPDKDLYAFTRYQVDLLDRALDTPSLLDQARQTHDAIWTRILNEDHQTIIALAGDLRQHTQSPAFARAWGAITSLVDARAMLSPSATQVETLVLRLDAVRAVHKVLLSVRSALLHNCNT